MRPPATIEGRGRHAENRAGRRRVAPPGATEEDCSRSLGLLRRHAVGEVETVESSIVGPRVLGRRRALDRLIGIARRRTGGISERRVAFRAAEWHSAR